MAICFKKKCYGRRLQDFLSNSIKEFFATKEVKEEVEALSGPKYKVYSTLLTQTGTSAPTAKLLENTIGTITIQYVESGRYQLKSAGLFPVNKTFYVLQQNNGGTRQHVIYSIDANTIEIQTSWADSLTDNELYNSPVEIRVYP